MCICDEFSAQVLEVMSSPRLFFFTRCCFVANCRKGMGTPTVRFRILLRGTNRRMLVITIHLLVALTFLEPSRASDGRICVFCWGSSREGRAGVHSVRHRYMHAMWCNHRNHPGQPIPSTACATFAAVHATLRSIQSWPTGLFEQRESE